MRRRCLPLILAAFFMFFVNAYAEDKAEGIFNAIVKVRATIPEHARTAQLLGTEREGNGVVIDGEGHVLTIGYLIVEAKSIEITGPDGKLVSATFVGYDYDSGFGLLRANKPLHVLPMKLGQSSEVKLGDPLVVAGHGGPESVQGTQVVSRREFAGYWEYLLEDAIFTSPPYTNFGGAALINRDGRLVGIGSLLTQVTIQGLGSLSANVFVPIDRLKPILGDLIAMGRSSQPPKPWLGLFAEETHGRVIVIRVLPGGPAEQANLKPGDIILKVGTHAVKGLADFYRKVWALGAAGVDVPLSVLQETWIRDIVVHSADRYPFFRLKPGTDVAALYR